MPEEPRQPIEDLLEAHAVKRRAEGGPFELHEATRRLLRDEAVRVHAPAPAVEKDVPAPSAWFLLWTRLAGAFGFIGLLGLAVVVIQQTAPRPSKVELAQAKSELEMGLAKAESVPVAPPAELKRSLGAASTEARLSSSQAAEPFSTLAAPASTPARNGRSTPLADSVSPMAAPRSIAPPAGQVEGDRSQSIRDTRSETRSVASTPQPEPAAKSRALAVSPLSGTPFQRVEVADGLRRNLQSPGLPAVLRSFHASLLGNRLRLEEADGSIYLGDIDPAGSSFSVTGTNRATGLVVRFVGRVTLAPTAPGGASALPTPTVLEGTVALGDRQQWRLRAEAGR
jgi:hypothetical protein